MGYYRGRSNNFRPMNNYNGSPLYPQRGPTMIYCNGKRPGMVAEEILAKGGDAKLQSIANPIEALVAMKGIIHARERARELGFDFRAVVNARNGIVHMRKVGYVEEADAQRADSAVIIDVAATTDEQKLAEAIAKQIR